MNINILIACDRNYLCHAVTALTSACENNPGNRLHIFLLHTELVDADTQGLQAHFSQYAAVIQFLRADESQFQRFHTHLHFTAATYLRLLCDQILPPDITRIIYLDCDVIVQTSLDKLFAMDMDGCTVAAVRDAWLNRPGAQTHLKVIPNVGRLDYFNSGILLIDLVRYRATHTGSSAIELLRRFSQHLTYLDQDGLNIVLHQQWKAIHPCWNVQSFWFAPHFQQQPVNMRTPYVLAALAQPAIVHYTGPDKPWHSDNAHPLKSQYWKYRQLTPYLRNDKSGQKLA